MVVNLCFLLGLLQKHYNYNKFCNNRKLEYIFHNTDENGNDFSSWRYFNYCITLLCILTFLFNNITCMYMNFRNVGK